MATILVKGMPWEYEETSYYGGSDVFNHDEAVEVLRITDNILSNNGIIFMPIFGTLLGFVREGDFIKNDYDIDLMIYGKDRIALIDLIPEFAKYGMMFTRKSEPWVYTFQYKSVSCDFYTIERASWPYNYRYCRIVENYIQKSFFEKVEKIEVFGIQVNVPANPENLLEYMYGKNWRTPQKGQAKTQTYALVHINAYRFVKRCISYARRHYL
jgi:phosphorylcholine metabolism protein LicD